MPEQIRALAIVLLLATFTFSLAKKALGERVPPQLFNHWRNAWFAVTLIAFISNNFWIYIVITALYLRFITKHEKNYFALFFVLLLALPGAGAYIPSFGPINKLLSIDYAKLLSLTILLPAYLSLRSKSDTLAFGKRWPDKLLLAYIILDILLNLREVTVTDGLRKGLYDFLGIFLPYYVASRGVKDLDQFREAAIAFILACFATAAIACFEIIRHWLLYSSLPEAWGVDWGMGNYLARGGDVRAIAALGQPIVLGYILSIAIGFYLFLIFPIKRTMIHRLGLALIVGGLISSLSRGPWAGAIVLILVFIATGPSAIKRLMTLAVVAMIALPLLGSLPGGEKIMNIIPFMGTADQENVDYRSRLIDAAMIVFKENLWFGSVGFRIELANLGMVQGEGIVDVVNSYIEIALEYGLVGLIIFVGFFALVLSTIHKSMKRIPDKKSELHLFGQTLLASLVSILVMITTVSSIIIIPVVYWMIAGLGIAYAQIVSAEYMGKAVTEKRPTLELAE